MLCRVSASAYRTPHASVVTVLRRLRRLAQGVALALLAIVAVAAIVHLTARSPGGICDDNAFHAVCAFWAKVIGNGILTSMWWFTVAHARAVPGEVAVVLLACSVVLAFVFVRRDELWVESSPPRLCSRSLLRRLVRLRHDELRSVRLVSYGPLHRLEAVSEDARTCPITHWHFGLERQRRLATSIARAIGVGH